MPSRSSRQSSRRCALRDGPHRAFEIGRGLFQTVIEKLLGERLAGFPDPRHAAIARVQRARMQRGAVERHPGGGDALAKRGEQLAIVGQKAALGKQPAIQPRRRGGERVLVASAGGGGADIARSARGAITAAALAPGDDPAPQEAPPGPLAPPAAPGQRRNSRY